MGLLKASALIRRFGYWLFRKGEVSFLASGENNSGVTKLELFLFWPEM
jgi:hypothetical protein